MRNNTWNFQDAQTKFSQLVENAMLNEPQIVTKFGNGAVVVLSYEQYEKIIKPKSDLVTFFRNSPLLEADIDISRNSDIPRNIKL